jgi:integrase
MAFKIRYRVPGPDGKWKHKSETLYDVSGKKGARAILTQRIGEVSIQNPEAGNMTLREFVEAYWKPYLERKGVKPSTRSGYQSVLDRHVFPVLGDVRLLDIVPLQIEQLVRSKQEEQRNKTKRRLSAQSIRNLVTLLKGIFSLPVDNDLIGRSPVRNRHKPVIQRREKPIWTPEQVRKIIEGVPENFRCLFVTAALTGARLGELLALQWEHLKLEERTLRIEQSLWKGQLIPPKTAGSVRSIPLGDNLAQVLSIWRNNSGRTGPEDFVFCNGEGKPLNPDVLRKDVLYPALDRLQIARSARAAGFHTFRHSAASFINAQTGNLKLAQRFLGHSQLSTTADIYTHTSEKAERETAVVLEKVIFGDLFPIVPKIETGEQQPDDSVMAKLRWCWDLWRA